MCLAANLSTYKLCHTVVDLSSDSTLVDSHQFDVSCVSRACIWEGARLSESGIPHSIAIDPDKPQPIQCDARESVSIRSESDFPKGKGQPVANHNLCQKPATATKLARPATKRNESDACLTAEDSRCPINKNSAGGKQK